MIATWIWISILVAAVVILIAVISMIIAQRRTASPEHIGLYFDKHFNTVLNEWDLVRRPKAKTWKRDIGLRLDSIDRDLTTLKGRRTDIDMRMRKLDNEVSSLL